MTVTLEPSYWQVEAIRHLLRTPEGGLLMDPGTRKTSCVLSAFHLLRKKKLADKMLVLAPLRACYSVWPAEVEKWNFPFKVSVLHGNKKEQALDEDADIYIMNYDGLAWLAEPGRFKRLLAHGRRWWLVPDEATKLKHTNTKRFKLLRPLLPRFERRTVLTGTPAPNGLMDLFGQVYVSDLGARLGRFITHYRREFFYPTGYGGYDWALQDGAKERIYARLDGLFYRVSDDVLGLPGRNEVPVWLELNPKTRKLYDSFEEEFIVELGRRTLTAANAGVLSTKLRQITGGALYDNDKRTVQVHEDKVEALTDLVEQLQGNPLLVGYEYTHHAELIVKALKRMGLKNVPVVGSGMTAKASDAVFQAFNRGEVPVLLCQADAAAHSLNLQEACHHVAWYGMTWNLETYEQFMKRVDRSGQKHLVTVHHLLAKGTIDEVMWYTVRGSKRRTQNEFLKAVLDRYSKRSK